MKEGDVYTWYYKNDDEYREQHAQSGTAYWCKDNQAVVKDGKLWDTYWGLFDVGSNHALIDPSEVDLEFVCNMNEVRIISAFHVEDYDKVYNLTHHRGCRKLYAVDEDAAESKKALRKKYQKKLREFQEEMAYAKRQVEHYTELLEEIENEV